MILLAANLSLAQSSNANSIGGIASDNSNIAFFKSIAPVMLLVIVIILGIALPLYFNKINKTLEKKQPLMAKFICIIMPATSWGALFGYLIGYAISEDDNITFALIIGSFAFAISSLSILELEKKSRTQKQSSNSDANLNNSVN